MNNVLKIILGVVAVVAAIGLIVWTKQGADNHKADLGAPTEIVDEESGITFEMYGEPVITETTSTIGTGQGEGTEIDVRRYTVDHGDWTEVLQIFDVPPGEVDFTAAALTTYDADGAGATELEDVEFVKIGGIDGARGTAPGQSEVDGEITKLDTVVFATQMRGYMVTGGVAQEQGADSIDVAERAQILQDSVHEP